jgi:hypothetical protein
MIIVTIRKAIVRGSRFWRRVVVSADSIIGSGGFSVARLVPMIRGKPRRPGLASGRLTEAFVEPLPADELAAWQQ